MLPLAGAAGGTSAPAPWATWAATSSTIRFGPWSWECRLPSRLEATLDGSVLADDNTQLRNLSDRVDHLLRVPGPRQPAARADDVVRRRADAADPRRNAGRTAAARQRRAVRRQQGKDVPLLHTAACPSCCRAALHEEAKNVPKTMIRSPGHYEEWLLACVGGPRPVSNFDYAGPLTEIVLLGVLAMRRPGTRIEWDSENMKVKNVPELNAFSHTEYRKGWTL